jgi:peptide/nickel transport system permease protein
MSSRRLLLPSAILLGWLGLALIGPLLPLVPNHMELPRILEGPGAAAWLGYDDLGRSVLDRLVIGARVSMLVAASVVAVSLLIGTAIGMVSGWLGGAVDHLLVRLIDVFLAFPAMLLAIALAGVLGPGIENVVIALSVVGWVGFARLSRAQTLILRHADHVQAARAIGCGTVRILALHILPLIAAPLIVEATFGIAGVIVAEAGLSFLGLGIQPPAPSWGSMIRDGTRYLLVAPHMVIIPSVALMMVVLSVNLLGDLLRDRLDVKRSANRLPVTPRRSP